MKKTYLYLIAIALLLGGNLYLFLGADAVESAGANGPYFEDIDFVKLQGISITFEGQQIEIAKTNTGWVLNQKYTVDEGFFNTLLSILERVEIRREINGWQGEKMGEVQLSFDGGQQKTFVFGSNVNRTKSYFIIDEEVAEVSVPGYRDNVIEVFMLHPDQWRDRLIIDASWRTIQEINIDYPDSEDVTITFDDKFFLVNGQSPLDSSAVVDYLNQFQVLQANEMISEGRFPKMDSLSKSAAKVTITMDDINNSQPLILNIFPNLEGQAYHLLTIGEEMMVVDKQRVEQMLASPDDFLTK